MFETLMNLPKGAHRGRSLCFALLIGAVLSGCCTRAGEEGGASASILERVEDGFADNNGVKIHYVSLGEGPLIVFIHGFPDFWYSWRDQMDALSGDYRCVAIDTRGYNKSDQPEGVENYAMPILVEDIAAVIRAVGEEKAIIVGHDWGGAQAWAFALMKPQMTDKLIICNLPHMRGMARELANNPAQEAVSQYARNFQKEGSEANLSAAGLAGMVSRGDPEALAAYTDAFNNSSLASMMNYYRANYPSPPYVEDTSPVIKAQMPVLMFHGLNDQVLKAGALSGTWDWLEKDLTLVTIPGVGHWVHREATDMVSETMKWWLAMRP